jgi:uncharacterized protein (DUF1015 family)
VPAISPFRALRYDEAVAGSLLDLVAPPYDVIDEADRRMYMERSPHNIVHLTLPESEEAAGATLADWRERGVMRLDDEPALWWISQEFTGPDDVERTRDGLAATIEVTPYSEGKVLPHELTHAEPKEGRLRLLRATRTQLEPIFLLYDADPLAERPDRDPDIEVDEGGVYSMLWRLPAEELELDVPLLIADGHHRYETAVAFREEEPGATHTLAVLVSARSPGVEIFPTHRVALAINGELEGFITSSWDQTSLTLYRQGGFSRIQTHAGELDTQAVERFEPYGVTYTPYADHAMALVDDGEADSAFLVRPPTIAQVAEYAARGETMPQKSTYFYPKLTSGLLLYAL